MLFRKILDSFGPGRSAKRSTTSSGSSNTGLSRHHRRRPLRLEPLEDRQMLSITLFVDADSTAATQDGLDWTHAYADLQSALTRAAELNSDALPQNDVEAIWIAEGTYCPTVELESDGARSASFSLVDGVSLYGGFVGTETTLDQRDLSAHATILSGDLGVLDDFADNAYTVVYCGEDIVATLDGLTITGGCAYASEAEETSHLERDSGGGVFNSGNLTLSNVSLLNNCATLNGGAIYNASEGQLLLENTSVSRNLAYYGAGIYNDGLLNVSNDSEIFNNLTVKTGRPSDVLSSEEIEALGDLSGCFVRCLEWHTLSEAANYLFANGSKEELSISLLLTPGLGGGIYNNGIAEVSDSTISGNQSLVGGGISNYGQLKIENVIFQENVAINGAGVANYGELEVIASQFQGNVGYFPYYYRLFGGTGKGAGIYNFDTGVVDIANSLFANNHGGGMVNCGHMTIVSSTITQNSAMFGGGIATHSESITELYNTIVAGNETRMGSIPLKGDNPDIGGILYDNPEVSGSIIGSNNIIGDGTGLSGLVDGVDGNQIGTAESPIDPGFIVTTQEETGLIRYELLSDSSAIDAGENSLAVDPDGDPLTTDLYGNDRILGNAVDIGAVETSISNTLAQTYVVTSLENTIAEDGVLTFIEAFLAADSNHAVGDAVAGSFMEQDTIRFAEGLVGTIFVDGELVISDDLRIEGFSPNRITFDAQGQNCVFTIAPDVMAALSGITITGGSADYGGGIYNYGDLTVIDTVIRDNTALDDGGGIYNEGVLTLTNSSIVNNSIPDKYVYFMQLPDGVTWNPCLGGGAYNAGTMTMVNVTVTGNSATYGGGICNNRSLTVTNSTISENSSGLYHESTGIATVLNNTIIAGNVRGNIFVTWCLVLRPIQVGADNSQQSEITGSNNLIGSSLGRYGLVDGVDGNQIGTADSPLNPMLSDLIQFSNGQWGYYIFPSSPVIDAGNDDLVPDGVTTDIVGNNRIMGNAVDIGACERIPVSVFFPDDLIPYHFTDPAVPLNLSSRMATVPRRSELPPRRFLMPMRVSMKDVVFAQASWSADDLAAVAKEIEGSAARKSTDASDAVFALDLTRYADLD